MSNVQEVIHDSKICDDNFYYSVILDNMGNNKIDVLQLFVKLLVLD